VDDDPAGAEAPASSMYVSVSIGRLGQEGEVSATLTAEDECSPSWMRCRSQVARIAAVRSAVHVAGALGCSGAPSEHMST
jgi:hypothetical protein